MNILESLPASESIGVCVIRTDVSGLLADYLKMIRFKQTKR